MYTVASYMWDVASSVCNVSACSRGTESSMWAVTASLWDAAGAAQATASSSWDILASVHVVHVLCGLFHPVCGLLRLTKTDD